MTKAEYIFNKHAAITPLVNSLAYVARNAPKGWLQRGLQKATLSTAQLDDMLSSIGSATSKGVSSASEVVKETAEAVSDFSLRKQVQGQFALERAAKKGALPRFFIDEVGKQDNQQAIAMKTLAIINQLPHFI